MEWLISTVVSKGLATVKFFVAQVAFLSRPKIQKFHSKFIQNFIEPKKTLENIFDKRDS